MFMTIRIPNKPTLVLLLFSLLLTISFQQSLNIPPTPASLDPKQDSPTPSPPISCSISRNNLASVTPFYDSSIAYQKNSQLLSFNGTQILLGLIDPQNYQQSLQEQFNNNLGTLIYYFGIILLPFLLALLISPFLCYLCCSQNNSYQEQLHNKALKTNKIFSLIMLISCLVLMGYSSIFLMEYQNLTQLNQQIYCSYDYMLDNLINGTINNGDSDDDNRYGNRYGRYNDDPKTKRQFIGLDNLYTRMLKLNTTQKQLQDIISPVSTSGNISFQILNKTKYLKTSLKQINNTNTISYRSPINTSSPKNTINSTFPNILGNTKSNNTLIGAAYYGVDTLQVIISTINQAVDQVLAQIPSYTIILQQQLKQVNQITSQIYQHNQDINKYLTIVNQQYIPIINKIIRYFQFSLIFIVGLFIVSLVIGFIRISKWKQPSTITNICNRMSIGCLSVFLVFASIIGIIMCVGNFVQFFGCQYIGNNFSNQQQFSTHMAPLISLDPKYSICFGHGNGNLTKIFFTNDFQVWVDSLNQIHQQIAEFNTDQYLDVFRQSYNPLNETTYQYLMARVLDINSQKDLNALKKVANYSNYKDCVMDGFNQDSWVPSLYEENKYVPCNVKDGEANYTTCENIDNIKNRAEGCRGCMDTSDIFYNQQNYKNVSSILASRYKGCSTFSSQLANIWHNFYKVKKQQIGPIYNKTQTIRLQFDAMSSYLLSNIDPLLQNILVKFDSAQYDVLDPNYGILSQLNCRPLGDDLRFMTDVICSNYLTFFYNKRLQFAYISGMIVIVIFFSAFYVRSAHKLQRAIRQSRIVPIYTNIVDENGFTTHLMQDDLRINPSGVQNRGQYYSN